MIRVVLLVLSLASMQCSALAQVRIAIPEHVRGTNLTPLIEAGFGDIYKAIDQDVIIEYVPVSRAFEMVKRGQLDAFGYFTELSPIENASLFKVPEALTDIRLFMGCSDGKTCTLSARNQYVVVGEELFTQRFCASRGLDCVAVIDDRIAIKTVRAGLADGYLLERINVGVGKCLSDQGIQLRPIANQHFDVFHYVDLELASQAETLAGAIRNAKLKASGRKGYTSCDQDILWSEPLY